MKKYIIAYDLGTSGMKLVLIHPTQGVIGVVRGEYPLHVPFLGYAEQNPETFWNCACDITKKALADGMMKAEEVAGIIFAAQWKGIIPVDEKMEPLHNAILWLDRRAGEQADWLNERLQVDSFRDSDYWPKVLWLKEEKSELYKKTVKILEINTWMKYKSCGTITSDITSHFTRSPKAEEQSWYNRILEVCGISRDLFPEMVASDEQVGTLTEAAAKETGLMAGTPVFGGCGDIPAIARGVGCEKDGDAHIYLGSSGWMAVTCGEKGWTGSRTSGFDREHKIHFFGLESVGLTITWSLQNLFAAEYEAMGEDVFAWLDEHMAEIPAGCEGLLGVPSLYGENTPFSPKLYASFLRLKNVHTRFAMHRALMEGICYMYRYHKEAYESAAGQRIKRVRSAGGGAKNKFWMQMMADVLQCQVEVDTQPQYAGSIGAARCVMKGLGMDDAMKASTGFIFTPNPSVEQQYEEAYQTFLKALPMISDL